MADPQHVPAVVVALPAEIDMANAGQLGQQLGSALAPSVTTVIADMTATTFCDSSGIKMLLRARKEAVANRTQLRLAVPSAAVRRTLTLVSMDQLVPIHPTLSQALAAEPAPGSRASTSDHRPAPPREPTDTGRQAAANPHRRLARPTGDLRPRRRPPRWRT
jgi:anti-anti-sigma factor